MDLALFIDGMMGGLESHAITVSCGAGRSSASLDARRQEMLSGV